MYAIILIFQVFFFMKIALALPFWYKNNVTDMVFDLAQLYRDTGKDVF